MSEEGEKRRSKFMAWAEGRSAEAGDDDSNGTGSEPQSQTKIKRRRSRVPSDLRSALLSLTSFVLAGAVSVDLVSDALNLVATELTALATVGIIVQLVGYAALAGGFVAAGEALRTRVGLDRQEGLRQSAVTLIVGATVLAVGSALILIALLTESPMKDTAEDVAASIEIAEWLLAGFAAYGAYEYLKNDAGLQSLVNPKSGLAVAAGSLSLLFALAALQQLSGYKGANSLTFLNLNGLGEVLQVFGYFIVSAGLVVATGAFSVLTEGKQSLRDHAGRTAAIVVVLGLGVAALGQLGPAFFFANDQNALSIIVGSALGALSLLLTAVAAGCVAAAYAGRSAASASS